MNEELYKKLSSSVNKINFNPSIKRRFKNGQITAVIDIYRYQVKHGGYPKSSYYFVGLKRLPKFGNWFHTRLEAELKEFGLPNLRTAPSVIGEYDAYKYKGYEPKVVLAILESALRGLGKPHDPETMDKIMAIIG